ncbi:hypothetical protein KAR91_14195 [Candidatus Pacearchaeota archaeon]|nr:hypothetical protein [Candidatus Pacearchaeota archaeon]
MAVSVDTTIGGASSNSYVSVADAGTYLESVLGTTLWDAASADNKAAAVVWATRLIDSYFTWEGIKIDIDQALDWPRYGAYDKNGYSILNDALPVMLPKAVTELARYLIDATSAGGSSSLGTAPDGLDKLKVGPIELTFNTETARGDILLDGVRSLPDHIVQLISHLGIVLVATANPSMRSVELGRV